MSDTEKPDLLEARRQAEYWVVQDAYDYSLAMLGRTRSSSSSVGLVQVLPHELVEVQNVAAKKLLKSAQALAAALLVDARLCDLKSFDKVLGSYGRATDSEASS